jgi:hypothetical protein
MSDERLSPLEAYDLLAAHASPAARGRLLSAALRETFGLRLPARAVSDLYAPDDLSSQGTTVVELSRFDRLGAHAASGPARLGLARCPSVDSSEWLVDWCLARDFLLRYLQLCLDSHWRWRDPGRTYGEANPGWTPVVQLAYLLLVVVAARVRVGDVSGHVAATGAEIGGVPVAELVDAYDSGPALLQRRAAHTQQANDYANTDDPRPPALVARQSTHGARQKVCRYLSGQR